MRTVVTRLMVVCSLAVPGIASAQDASPPLRVSFDPAPAVARDAARGPRLGGSDSVANGLVIGGAIGAVGGLIVAPYFLCGTGFDDTECTAIVRAVLGIPIIAGGLIAGGLIDKYHVRGPVIWKDKKGKAMAAIGRFPRGGTGAQMVLRF